MDINWMFEWKWKEESTTGSPCTWIFFFFFYKRGNKCLLYCFKMASLSMIKHHLHEIFLECLYIKLITKLLTRYIAFFWPVFEYSDVVWENCSENDAKHLKYNQVETARMITGLRLMSLVQSYCHPAHTHILSISEI